MIFKELRTFMQEVRNFMRNTSVGNEVLNGVIKQQEKMIEGLTTKLLARNLPELKMFQLEDVITREVPYNPFEDETNAGEILNLPDKGNQ